MSTLNLPSRLLKSNRFVPLSLGLCFGLSLAGCSTTSGNRTGSMSMSKAKTFLSVGDKPLPVVSGEPGSTVAADTDPEPQVAPRNGRPDGRISGRVFDADGRPAPEARVRLAVSGAAGGKVVRASTDRSGAFTLHGLRPGSTYTVIAEWEGDDGLMSGRSEARTSDTDVRISLAPADAPPRRAGAQSRVNRVSDREVEDEDATVPAEVAPAVEPDDGATSRSRRRVNEEDLPPAPEAESLAPPNRTRASNSTSISTRRARMGTAQAETWRQGVRDGSTAGRAEGPSEPEAQETPAVSNDGETPYDEGPNPLPPALEPAEEPDKSASTSAGGRAEADPFAEDPPRVAARAPAPRPRSSHAPAPSNTTRRPAASLPFESPSRPSEAPARSAPIDTAPGALVVVPETFAPVVLHDADPFAPPAAPEPAPRPAAVRPTRQRSNASADSTSRSARPSNAPGASLASRDRLDANGRRRRTWGEVASTESAVPPLEGEAEAETETGGRSLGAKADAGIALRSLSSDDRSTTSVARAVGTDKGSLKPSCEYDERLRRINDFRLPDINGKLVRFQDFDADLVLIDFWGTWCQPCLQSIPHLVDLQERMGRRLAVIGVACEPEATDQAAIRVSETIKRLKINYPVLISRNDGSCPLQEALHVQAFPTMILVDREGRVLWRDQGSTPTTLSRLDRFLASASPADDTRRN